MKCTSPITRRYLDALTNEWKECVCPCGKCVACRHNLQDQWVVRLSEEIRDKKYMIFDTLTIAPDSMYYKDMKEPVKHLRPIDKVDGHLVYEDEPSLETLYGSTERWRHWKVNSWNKYKSFHRYYPNVSFDSYKILRRNNFQLLSFPKAEVQKWFKRGRIAYERFYGSTPRFSYFLVQEYGDVTSRPHFHVLVFGLPYQDYMRFWGNPWRRTFGFIRPQTIVYSPFKLKDINNTIRYVAKYICKGSDEIPLVKDGLYDKPYRLISKGIGESYLDDRKFIPFKDSKFDKWKEESSCSLSTLFRRLNEVLGGSKHWSPEVYSAGGIKESWDYIHKLLKKSGRFKSYYDIITRYNSLQSKLKEIKAVEDELSFLEICTDDDNKIDSMADLRSRTVDTSGLLDKDLESLVVYYQPGSNYPHALPRYYRTKLFQNGKENNVYAHKIQDLLLARAELLDNQSISEFASGLGYRIDPRGINKKEGTIEGLSSSDAFMVFFQYAVAKKNKAEAESERRQLKDTNFFNRIKSRTDAPALR